MIIKKKNSLFGRYPSCDHLNNALRFIRENNIECATEEIIFAINKANGYFHKDNIPMVTETQEKWCVKHTNNAT